MSRFKILIAHAVLGVSLLNPARDAFTQDGKGTQDRTSTRIEDEAVYRRSAGRRYPYRAKSDYVLKELDLRPGDVVIDIGAGDGWWSDLFAKAVGKKGVVHAAEVVQKHVDSMRKRFAKSPQVRPYLSDKDSTTLPENSCDLAFFSQSFHHLDSTTRIDYLRHLRKVVKPLGRVVIIEKYSRFAGRSPSHGTNASALTKEAEDAGWVLARYELMRGTDHYLAVFVHRDLLPWKRRARSTKRRRI
jgi:ubiquinone/menaquinone biosynthesis C-methylase UbiE